MPRVYKELYERNLDNVDPSADEHNIIMLGSDFSECEEIAGYMEGAVRIANRKVNKCILPKLWSFTSMHLSYLLSYTYISSKTQKGE